MSALKMKHFLKAFQDFCSVQRALASQCGYIYISHNSNLAFTHNKTPILSTLVPISNWFKIILQRGGMLFKDPNNSNNADAILFLFTVKRKERGNIRNKGNKKIRILWVKKIEQNY